MIKLVKNLLLQSVLLFIFCLLSGCRQDTSVNFYLLHPEKIKSSYEKCSQSQPAFQSSECVNLMKAIPIVEKYLAELLHQPGQFGLNIMQSEYKLVQLKKTLQLLPGSSQNRDQKNMLLNDIKQQELDIQVRFAVMRLVFRLGSVYNSLD